MCVSVLFAVKYAEMIEFVYSYLAARVYDVTFRQDNPDMGDVPSAIVEEGQITRLTLLRKINGATLYYLLVCISEQPDSRSFEHHLGETGTVNSKR